MNGIETYLFVYPQKTDTANHESYLQMNKSNPWHDRQSLPPKNPEDIYPELEPPPRTSIMYVTIQPEVIFWVNIFST
jgi:hypothetical protein